jgi:hypothetical protein
MDENIPGHDSRLGPQHFRNIANYALELVERLLGEEAAKHNGRLTEEEINRIINIVKDTPQSLWVYYRNSFEKCFPNTKENEALKYLRKDYFFRLIIATFEDRLSNPHVEDEGPNVIPRNSIEPFEIALKVILGEDFMAQSREECSNIVDDLHHQLGEQFRWRDFYENEQSMSILVTTCAMIANSFRHFKDHEKWFLHVIENNLDQDLQSLNDGVVEFGEADFKTLFTCLFEGYANCVQKMGGNAWLASILNAEQISAVEHFRKNLSSL